MKIQWLLMVAVLFAAAFVRLHNIDVQSLWHDEGNSLRLAERSIHQLINAAGRDIHPPGYYLALKGWISLIGISEFGLRSLSALWGVVMVAATYALGKQLTHRPRVGLLAALLVAINPFGIYYGQETRMYAQLGALSILSLWLVVRFFASQHQQWQWGFALALCNTLGLYTHYTFPFTMIVQGVYALWHMLQQQNSVRYFVTYVVVNIGTLLLFLPWLPTAYDQITTWPSTGDQTPTVERLERIFTILIYGNTIDTLSITAFTVPLALVLLALRPRRNLISQSAAPALLVALSIGSLLTSGAYREANLKFLLPAQAAMMLLLAQGAMQFTTLRPMANHRPVLAYVGISSVILVFLAPNLSKGIDALYNDPHYARSDYRGIVQTINRIATDDSAVILNAPNQQEVFSYYYNAPQPVYPLPRGLGGDDPATQQATSQIIVNHERVFLVLWGQQERDPNAVVQSTLDHNAFVVGREWYGDVELVQYAVLGVPPPTPQTPVNVRFGEHIVLEGYTLSASTFTAGRGEALGVALYWRTDETLTVRYKVSVQILTPQGTLANQHDSEPANGLRPTTSWAINEIILDNHGLVLNPNLPPGEYTLNVVVYDANPPQERLVPEIAEADALLHLGTLTIIPAD